MFTWNLFWIPQFMCLFRTQGVIMHLRVHRIRLLAARLGARFSCAIKTGAYRSLNVLIASFCEMMALPRNFTRT